MASLAEDINRNISTSNTTRRSRRRSSPPPPDQEGTGEDDVSDFLCSLKSDVIGENSATNENDFMNNSMALSDLPETRNNMPRKERSTGARRKRFAQRLIKPVRSILRNGSGLKRESKAQLTDDFKRLSFALSPTFISEPPARRSVSDSHANESVLSLDDEEIFGTDDSIPHETSLRFGDSSDEKPTRRSSLSQMKAKSSLGFDERFVGFNESELGSLGNLSFSSI